MVFIHKDTVAHHHLRFGGTVSVRSAEQYKTEAGKNEFHKVKLHILTKYLQHSLSLRSIRHICTAFMWPSYLISAENLLQCMRHNDWTVSSMLPYDKKLKLNRCTLASSQGALHLSIPLLHGRNQRGLLKDIQIDNRHKWKREHLHSIKTVYGKAPFFMYYFDALREQMLQEHTHLLPYNISLINTLLKQMRFTEQISITDTTVQAEPSGAPKASLYYTQLFEYKTGFVPHCSVIDLLFVHGPDAITILRAHL